jgi:hypothetical protein
MVCDKVLLTCFCPKLNISMVTSRLITSGQSDDF